MPAMSWKQDPVAFAELAVASLALDPQPRSTGNDKHPLVCLLVVPLSFGSRLPGRHDALNAQARTFNKRIDDLVWKRPVQQIARKIARFDHRLA